MAGLLAQSLGVTQDSAGTATASRSNVGTRGCAVLAAGERQYAGTTSLKSMSLKGQNVQSIAQL